METYGPEALNFTSVSVVQDALAAFRADRLPDPAAFEETLGGYLAAQVKVPFDGWGHDHDFGTFQIAGRMGTRHVWMLSRLFDHFGVSIANDVAGKRVLDVGCWSGGVSLVLAQLGAEVEAIDTGDVYIDALRYQAQIFGLTTLHAEARSVYDFPSAYEPFDSIFFLGVAYHFEDPVGALRQMHRLLKPNGLLCVESMAIDRDDSLCEYIGPLLGRPNTGYIPSPVALRAWIADADFVSIVVGNGLKELAVTSDRDPMGGCRVFAVARKPMG